MPDADPRIVHLAEAYGISTEFWDWKGHGQQPSQATLIACLTALGVDTEQEFWIDKAFQSLDERPWKQPLPECVVIEQNQEATVDVHVPSGRPAHVWVKLESGYTFSLEQADNPVPDRQIDGKWVGRATFRLPSEVIPGYHTLNLESDDQSWQCPFIVTPSWVGLPQVGAGSVWGFMAQLYSVCSKSSWGVGDFTDLADLAVWAKTQHGADFILINPTHAAEVASHMEPSPYFPATRRYINPIYIRPEDIEEYATAPTTVRTQVQRLRRQAYATTKASRQVLRDPVWEAKKQALKLIFQLDRRPPRQMQFEAYRASQADSLRRYAVWCVLSETYGSAWTAWPKEYRNPHSEQTREFAELNSDDVTFYMWLQWVAGLQAKRAQILTAETDMAIGIMSDLAVGVNMDGEETWARQGLFAHGVTVGAPPDAYNQAGQDWRQPPWRPDKLRSQAYAPLRAMISAMMNSSGAVRIDHIIGLFRLWWIPQGMAPGEGAYIRYDYEAMVGILALEAHRAQTAVIGEDLGTVEPWVRDYLARRGILGTSILWFEMDDCGNPLTPDQWRPLCLGSVTTHDLPPTLGYLAHDHVELRHRLGLLTEPLADEIARDAQDQSSVLTLLTQRGLIEEGETDPTKIMIGLHRFLAQTDAKLKCVSLTDVVGERRTQNQPGTIDEYPNWRIPLGDESAKRLTLEDIYGLTSVKDVSDILNGKV